RDCPAAVSGNESCRQHWVSTRRSRPPGKRRSADRTVLDAPATPTSPSPWLSRWCIRTAGGPGLGEGPLEPARSTRRRAPCFAVTLAQARAPAFDEGEKLHDRQHCGFRVTSALHSARLSAHRSAA